MRRGELLALTWDNVDLKQRTAHLPDTKNGESRTVPLSTRAVTILDGLERSHTGRVFPISPMALRKGFAREIARARAKYVSRIARPRVAPLAPGFWRMFISMIPAMKRRRGWRQSFPMCWSCPP